MKPYLVVALALALPAAASTTRVVGKQPDGSIIVSDNQRLTPAGKTLPLGSPVRAKAIALNPKGGTASVLLMHADAAVVVFDTATGAVIQRYAPGPVKGGAMTGIAYSADGTKLFFSQDRHGTTSGGMLAVANVDPAHGTLSPAPGVDLPVLPFIGNPFAAHAINPAGIALTGEGATALVALNAQNSVGVIDIAAGKLVKQIPVGNAPNRILILGDKAYVTNEGGRTAGPGDFTDLSDGTPIVADRDESFATTGTVSVIDLTTQTVTRSIDVGLHPAGIAAAGNTIYVANTYSDTISVIDAGTAQVTRTIGIPVPIEGGAFGNGVNDIAVVGDVGYVTLGQSNAIAVVDLASGKVAGLIPTGYFPTTIAYDTTGSQLVVSNDKGTGTQGSIASTQGASGYSTHQDTGTVSLIPIPTTADLAADTAQVIDNNDWHSPNTHTAARYADTAAAPVAIPVHIGEPSLIKHVFLVIKENRTYDQVLGDLPQGNGDKSLAVFSADTPNQHALVRRFPLLDNIYAPSRQSADGHPWIVEAGSFYSNEILSPDWIRSYPGGNSNDALTYTPRGFLWSGAEKAGLGVKLYGEWSGGDTIATKPDGGAYSWADFYNTHLYVITGGKQGARIVPPDADTEASTVASAAAVLDRHYPSFNLVIPDQCRADYWIADFAKQVAENRVPALSVIWLPNDHTAGVTAGLPLPANYQADNDLALGRMVEAISQSPVWKTTAIFVEEDDSQNGVDHIDGHRQPVYVISPYTVPPQAPNVGQVIHTTYTQLNIDRTIENILGLQPLTQFDLVASPMFDVFQDAPNLAAFTHVPATTPLNIGPGGTPIDGTGPAAYASMTPMEAAWSAASNAMFKGRLDKPDLVDDRFLNHATWYSATAWSRPYPGEKTLLEPSELGK